MFTTDVFTFLRDVDNRCLHLGEDYSCWPWQGLGFPCLILSGFYCVLGWFSVPFLARNHASLKLSPSIENLWRSTCFIWQFFLFVKFVTGILGSSQFQILVASALATFLRYVCNTVLCEGCLPPRRQWWCWFAPSFCLGFVAFCLVLVQNCTRTHWG